MIKRTIGVLLLAGVWSGFASAELPTHPQLLTPEAGVSDWIEISGVTNPKTPITLWPLDGRRRRARRARAVELSGLDRAVVRVPSLRAGSYEVLVGKRRNRLHAGIVEISEPRVDGLAPLASDDDSRDSITITGRGFGGRAGRVRFGRRRARVLSWSAERIVARVPSGLAKAADVQIRAAAGRVLRPCGVLAVGSERSVGPTDRLDQGSWEFRWTPTSGGSVYGARHWNWTQLSYSPESERFSIEVNLDQEQQAEGLYFVLTEGGKPNDVPDEYAAVFLDFAQAEPVVNVFAYNGTRLGANWKDGWYSHGHPAPDRVTSSVLDPSLLLDLSDRAETDGTRSIRLSLSTRRINAHVPTLHRRDASTWRGLAFGESVGMWVYLSPQTRSAYADGWLTQFDAGEFRIAPSIDGSDYAASWRSEEAEVEFVSLPTGDVPVIHGTPESDQLVGTPEADVFRAGPGEDSISTGAGDDVVVFDELTESATVDLGVGGHDVLQMRPDPLRWTNGVPPTGVEVAQTVTLWLAPPSEPSEGDVPPGSAPEPFLGEGGEILLPPDSAGRLTLPNGETIHFHGLESIRL